MATTTNYSWATPDDTALVKDGASAIRTLGSSVDTTVKNLNPETTLGDLAYRSSTANVKTRLGLGTAGQLLAVNSGATAPEWISFASGGMTLINSGGTTLTGASVTISSIPATYKDLQLIVREFKPATDGQDMRLRLNGDSATRYAVRSTSTSSADTFSATQIDLTKVQDNSVATGLTAVTIYDYANTTTWKMGYYKSVTVDSTTTTSFQYQFEDFLYNQTGAINSITLLPGTGNFTSGTAFLYGVN